MLLVCAVIAWAVMHSFQLAEIDHEYARKGQVSPRMEAKYGANAKSQSEGWGIVAFARDNLRSSLVHRTELMAKAREAKARGEDPKAAAQKVLDPEEATAKKPETERSSTTPNDATGTVIHDGTVYSWSCSACGQSKGGFPSEEAATAHLAGTHRCYQTGCDRCGARQLGLPTTEACRQWEAAHVCPPPVETPSTPPAAAPEDATRPGPRHAAPEKAPLTYLPTAFAPPPTSDVSGGWECGWCGTRGVGPTSLAAHHCYIVECPKCGERASGFATPEECNAWETQHVCQPNTGGKPPTKPLPGNVIPIPAQEESSTTTKCLRCGERASGFATPKERRAWETQHVCQSNTGGNTPPTPLVLPEHVPSAVAPTLALTAREQYDKGRWLEWKCPRCGKRGFGRAEREEHTCFITECRRCCEVSPRFDTAAECQAWKAQHVCGRDTSDKPPTSPPPINVIPFPAPPAQEDSMSQPLTPNVPTGEATTIPQFLEQTKQIALHVAGLRERIAAAVADLATTVETMEASAAAIEVPKRLAENIAGAREAVAALSASYSGAMEQLNGAMRAVQEEFAQHMAGVELSASTGGLANKEAYAGA